MRIEFHGEVSERNHTSCNLSMAEFLTGAEGYVHAEELVHAVMGTHPAYLRAYVCDTEERRVLAVYYHDKDTGVYRMVAKDPGYQGRLELASLYYSTRLVTHVMHGRLQSANTPEGWASRHLVGGAATAIMLSPDGRVLRAWEQDRMGMKLVARGG